jgi:hypothetical protein
MPPVIATHLHLQLEQSVGRIPRCDRIDTLLPESSEAALGYPQSCRNAAGMVGF